MQKTIPPKIATSIVARVLTPLQLTTLFLLEISIGRDFGALKG